MTDSIEDIAAKRQKECNEKALYFESRLRFFSKTNWITVIVPSLLGVIAGSALFSTTNSVWLGIGALIAALLTAIHKGLDCDSHQTECRRLVQAYRGLETRYRTISDIKSDSACKQLVKLDEQLAELKESQLATTSPQWIKDERNDA